MNVTEGPRPMSDVQLRNESDAADLDAIRRFLPYRERGSVILVVGN